MEITLEDGTSLPLEEATKEQLATHYETLSDSLDKYKEANPEHRTQEAQKLDRVIKVSKDANNFVDLYETDPKMAKKVVDYNNKIHWEEFTCDDYLEQIKTWDKEKDSDDEIISKVEAKLEKKEAKKTYNDFLNKKEIDKDSGFGKDVILLYDDLVEWKKLNSEKVNKYLKIALREAKRTSEFSESYKKAIDEVQGIGSPKKGNVAKARKPYVKPQASIFDYIKK